jgi:hypothetical protein
MPVTGKDPILNTAPVQRKAHMRATVVERVNLALVMNEDDDVAV